MGTRELTRASAQIRDACNARVAKSGLAALPSHRATSSRSVDTSFDQVILVDESDRMLGTMPKLEAHRRGFCHRAISVLVRDRCGRLLLQQRAAGKYHSPKLWTNTCCSHPRPAEPAVDAAARRLTEEMGIIASLTPLFTMRYRALVSKDLVEHEFVHVFGGVCDQTPKPAPSEVASWRWMSLDDVIADLDRRPRAYTVWFRGMLRDFNAEIMRFLDR